MASVVMIAAIAVLIVLIGLKAGAGMSGTIDKRRHFLPCQQKKI